ncbi:hypothetical protein [Pseudorhodoferax sp.]|uniref:hypothetical protein n=1 Tax=Pseudorhodoferax sp. TaxID=1993553 RepID=UPI002DD621DA|nr:hypothetical protein [Pseudorhodoferax sp.]
MARWIDVAIRNGRIWMVGLVLALVGCGGGGDDAAPAPPPPVASPPSISRQPEAQTVTEGGAAVFRVEAAGDGLSYQWLRDGVAVPGAEQASLTVAAAAQTDNGRRWAVRLSNASGSTLSQDALLTVVPALPAPRLSVLVGDIGGSGSTDGIGRAARFKQISGIAADADGVVYVADTGNATLRKVMPDGRVSTLAGMAGQTGSVDGQGSAARFMNPTDVAVMPDGTLLVADGDKLRRVTAQGAVTTLATPGLPAALALAVDRAGTVFISTGSSIWRMARNAAPVVFAGFYGIEMTWDGVGQNARFDHIIDLVVASDGQIQVTQLYGPMRRVSPDGEVSTVTDATGQSLDYYSGGGRLAVDADGSLWVSNQPAMLSKLAPGTPPAPAFDTTEQLRVDMGYAPPGAIAFLPSGDLVFAAKHGIARIKRTGAYSEVAGSAFVVASPVADAAALATDREGHVLLATASRQGIGVQRRAATTSEELPFASGPVTIDAQGAAGAPAGGFLGLGVDAGHRLLVGGASVAYPSQPGGQTRLYGGAIYGLSGQGAVVSLAQWLSSDISPANLVTDRLGDAWFIDLQSERLMQRDAAGTLTAWAPVGTAYSRSGYGTDFNVFPVVGADGQAYVINRYTKTISRAEREQLVPWIGQAQAQAAVDGPAPQARFRTPGPGVFDSRGYLYVADGELIRRIAPDGTVVTVAGSAGNIGIVAGPLPAALGQVRALALASDRVLLALVDAALVRLDLPAAP